MEDEKNKENEQILEMLNKMNKFKKSEQLFLYKTMCVFVTIIGTIITIFVCLMMYKNNSSIESLLSMLLAFFSIFISIFFYFKASDTSNNFYDKSYDIMKDVSITLGKIEAQFGEKLNNLNDKVSALTVKEYATKEKLENVVAEREEIIEEMIENPPIESDKKEEYRKILQTKVNEIKALENELYQIKNQKSEYSYVNIDKAKIYLQILNKLDKSTLERIINEEMGTSQLQSIILEKTGNTYNKPTVCGFRRWLLSYYSAFGYSNKE